MILINLLPHREEKRRQRKRAFFVGLVAAAGVGLVSGLRWAAAGLRWMPTTRLGAASSVLRSLMQVLHASGLAGSWHSRQPSR